jgi:kynurenine formamidase
MWRISDVPYTKEFMMAEKSLAERLLAAKVYDLEQPRFFGMPIFPSHKPGYFYALHRRHQDTYQPEQHGPRTGASGVLTMMEHSGTHIDALCHQACDLKMFGDIPVHGAETPAGFTKHGVEMVPPLVGRGILLDAARSRGVDRLPSMYGISATDLEACATGQGTEVHPGDVLLVRTGYGTLWNNEEAYLEAAGIAKSGSQWVGERGVRAIGADNLTWDVPGERDPETGATLYAHVNLLAQRGIFIIENLNLEELASDRRYEFAFIGVPLKFQGATGSPIRPLALVDE